MFKFMLNNNSEIMFYDTESHMIFSLGYFLAKVQENTRPYEYQLINPITNCFPTEGDQGPDEEAKEQFLNWVSQGLGYPRIYASFYDSASDFYFDKVKIFKDGKYHGINDANKLWDLNAIMSSQLYATTCRGFSEVTEEFKEYSPIYFCYNSTAADTTNKTLQILSPESTDWIRYGAVVHVFNENTNTATNPKFYIQNQAIPIYYEGQPITTDNLDLAGKAGQILTYYIYLEEGDNNQTTRCAMYMGSSEQNILTAGTNITINNNTISATDTKNTAGSVDNSNKLYLIGATSQAANPQTYSNYKVYVQNGLLRADTLTIGQRKSGSTVGSNSVAEGIDTIASGSASHAEGNITTASGTYSHAEGTSNTASGNYSHAEGQGNRATSQDSHAEGASNLASQSCAHVEGGYSIAQGEYSHAEGYNTFASGKGSHAEGSSSVNPTGGTIILTGEANAVTYTTSDTSQAKIGCYISTAANSMTTYSPKIIAISSNTSITLDHSLGSAVTGQTYYIHQLTMAAGDGSHAEGMGTKASGHYSHAEGMGTIAGRKGQHVEGKYNISESETPNVDGTYLHIAGNGTSDSARSNAYTLASDGTAWFANDVYVKSTSGTNKDSGSKKLATEEYVTTRGYVTTDTKNTAGSTDSSSKLFLIGATSQATNPQTYSDNEVFAQDGVLNAQEITIGSRQSGSTIGTRSSVFGNTNVASGENSVAEGVLTTASGNDSHAEGGYTTASAYYSHAEGHRSIATDGCSHAEGYFTVANNTAAHAENGNSLQRTVIITGDANATTYTTTNTNNAKVGQYLKYQNEVRKITALVENTSITVETTFSNNKITSQTAYLMSTTASGQSSHAEGRDTLASGACSHAEGSNTQATNGSSHAEGINTTASGLYSHAEGEYTTASSGTAPHAEGRYTTASGTASHAEGGYTNITGNYGHGEGQGTKSTNRSQHVQGEYNIHDNSGNNVNLGTYAHIVGNGTADNARSNAHTLDWSGNAWYAGDVYTGSTSGTNKDSGSKKLATEEYVTTRGYITTDTKNTAGSTDTSSKIYLVGATEQSANPQTYSDDEVYATSGTLTAKEFSLGTNAKIVYNTSESCIEFSFS